MRAYATRVNQEEYDAKVSSSGVRLYETERARKCSETEVETEESVYPP